MNNTKLFAILALALSIGLTTACGNNENNEDNNPVADVTPDTTKVDETADVKTDEQVDEEGDSTGGDEFVFATEAPADYTQIDRAGFPAVNTALVTSKDAYNAGSIADDVAGTWATELVGNLTGVHDALRDDLEGQGLVRCSTGEGVGTDEGNVDVSPCLAQKVLGDVTVQGAVIPDVLNIVPSLPAGFPNGRKLADPVIDVTLAVILLDMSATGQDPTSLVGVLNPAENDVNGGVFGATFPYLLAPQTPAE